jgi:hypothetical protein
MMPVRARVTQDGAICRPSCSCQLLPPRHLADAGPRLLAAPARTSSAGLTSSANMIADGTSEREVSAQGLRTIVAEPEAAAWDMRVHAEPSRAPVDLHFGKRARVFLWAAGSGA